MRGAASVATGIAVTGASGERTRDESDAGGPMQRLRELRGSQASASFAASKVWTRNSLGCFSG
jgi:hypothetical protein